MAENRDEQQRNDSQEYEFVKERIIEKPKKRSFFVRLIGMIVLGLVFGGMGAVAFAVALPYARDVFEKPTETTSFDEQIVIPKDDEEDNNTEELTSSITEPSTQPNETEQEEMTTEPAEEVVLAKEEVLELIEEALANREPEIADYEALYRSMFNLVSEANNSIVTITSIKNNTDILNNTYEDSENTSGIIYSLTDNSVFILTDWDSVREADFIRVSFLSGFSCNAEVRMYDRSSNMAVISVDTVLFDEHSFDKIKVITLGNSNVVKQGDPVIAIGNPMGYMYTMSYGIVTTVKNSIQSVDAIYRLLDTNVIKGNEGNGFLINLDGELIGIITDKLNNNENTTDTNVLTAMALSDLKGRLEVISNNREVAYLGIIGQDITSDIAASQDLPRGIYVSRIIIDSPIYAAGLQNGDIIIAMDDMDNMSMKSMRNYLEEKAVGDVVTVVIMRKGKNGYTEMILEVELGAYK